MTLMRWYHHRFNTSFSFKIIFTIIPRVPKIFHPPIAAVTASIFFLLLKRERRALLGNLNQIGITGPGKRLWLSYQAFYSFCDFIVSYCYVPDAGFKDLIDMLTDKDWGSEVILSCLKKGKGLIVWTAHVGNWEFGSRLLELTGTKVNTARVVEEGKPTEAFLRRLMTNDRLGVIKLNEDAFGSIRILHALRRNEIVAIQGDRVYQKYTEKVTFFGRKTRFPLGPFLLSYISGAPIIPAFVIREKWLKYRSIMGKPIILEQQEDKARALKRGLCEAVQALQEIIRNHPKQWMNFYAFWAESEFTGDENL